MTSTTSTRDTLLAALRDSPYPLSTAELATLAPWHREQVVHHRRWYHQPSDNARLVICAGVFDVVDFRPDTKDIYRHLRALESAGLVVKVRVLGMRWVYWTAVVSATAVTVGQLEAMWSA
jgi:hypothetical protein